MTAGVLCSLVVAKVVILPHREHVLPEIGMGVTLTRRPSAWG